MKKYSLFIFLVCLQTNDIIAQKNLFIDSVLIVSYNITHQLPNFQATSSSKLIIDGTVSYYFGSSEFIKNGEILNAGIVKYSDSSHLLFCQPMMPKYDKYTYFSDSLHPMKWEFTEKKIELNGRVGYEAKTFFRGRYFTAYYDPKIPFSNGPLKFGGLPGLIIKLYDKELRWNFELISIKPELRTFKGNKMNYAGDYQKFLSIYPEWRKRLEEKLAATESVDPNCPTCGSKNTHYSIEIY